MGPSPDLSRKLCSLLGARAAQPRAQVAELWSGYGEIRRFALEGCDAKSVIVKQVTPPRTPAHRRGWATDRSHQRKVQSYVVEQAFYATFASRCTTESRLPLAHHLERDGDRFLFVLEDLDAAGYPQRRSVPSEDELHACLDWLAHFHARFVGCAPDGLWQEGTYWHLATRPDELEVMQDDALRDAAEAIDRRLREARFRTLVHGDAKVANFCFGARNAVAAVDFQYVGGGVGVKDVAYLLSSCLSSAECAAREQALLDRYFATLRMSLEREQPSVDAASMEAEWRALYPWAWADFTRFLAGWAPTHHKLHAYSLGLTQQVLAQLGSTPP